MLTITDGFGYTYNLKSFKFPVGEISVSVDPMIRSGFDFEYVFDGSDSILELLLAASAVKSLGGGLGRLKMDYVPFSRQDRIMNPGESFSLKVFCDLINGLGFKEVHIKDPHSDVCGALLNNVRITPQWDIMAPVIHERFCSEVQYGYKKEYPAREHFYLVSPDGGALKKIYKLAEKVPCRGVVECSKKRSVKDGKITGVTFRAEDDLEGIYSCPNLIIVDDILDGGMTHIKLSEEIRNTNYGGKITLMVTHGFFTKGMDIFPDIDAIWCSNKGWVK